MFDVQIRQLRKGIVYLLSREYFSTNMFEKKVYSLRDAVRNGYADGKERLAESLKKKNRDCAIITQTCKEFARPFVECTK